MPTRPDFDLVPVRKATKRRLAELKQERTYDEVIAGLLDRRERPPTPPRGRERAPEEVSALVDLAARRWRIRLDEGRLVEMGPRMFIYRTQEAVQGRLRVRWPDRRGFAP